MGQTLTVVKSEPLPTLSVVKSEPADTPLPVFRSSTDDPEDWSTELGLHEPTDSRVVGFMRGAGTAAVDMAQGVKGSALRTVYNGGDIIRRLVGASRVANTPDAQRAMHIPDTFQGTVGRAVEQALEFGVPLSKISKVVAKSYLLTRMAAEGLASGAIGAVESGGDPKQTAEAAAFGGVMPAAGALIRGGARAAVRAAAGAEEGGLRGGVASLVRTGAPLSSKAMMIQALKPSNARIGFEGALGRAMPELNAVATESGKPIESLADVLEAAKAAKLKVRAQYNAMAGPQRAMGSTVDLSPVADAMDASIPSKVKLEDPRAAAAMMDKAQVYRSGPADGRFPLEQAEQLLKETNAELDAYYKKFPQARGKAELANPETAHLVAQAKALRTAIYTTLDNPAQGAAAREVQQRYGALLEIEDAATRRANVAARQQPESLSQQIGKVRAAGQIAKGGYRLLHGDISGAADIAGARASTAMADYLKEQQTTDTLIKRAFRGFTDHPEPIEMPQTRPVSGLLDRGAIPMQSAPDGSFVRSVPAQPAQSERLALPAGRPSIQAPPAPDGSFVRSVPAIVEPSNPRRLLPAARKPAIPLPGKVAPPAVDPSSATATPAAPIAYSVDPTVTVKAGGVRVAQFSGDPKAARAAIADTATRGMLKRMLEDLDTFEPQRGKMVHKGLDPAEEPYYAYGGAGSPVADDIRVISEQHVSNAKVKRAIRDLLAGKMPTNRLHTAALDAAMGYLEKRSGYVGPSVPVSADRPAQSDDDAAFEAFSRLVDRLGKEP